jgi:lipoprotein
MKKVFLATFIPLLLSCQQDQMREISATDADIVARSMKFMTLSQSIGKFKKTQQETRVNNPDDRTDDQVDNSDNDGHMGEDFTIGIFGWDWGRPKKNCTGFGICDFTWFPALKKEHDIHISLPADDTNASLLMQTSEGQTYTDLLLAEPMKDEYKEEIPPLPVEKSILYSASVNGKKVSYKLKKGEYHFNPELGEHGGYRILLHKE